MNRRLVVLAAAVAVSSVVSTTRAATVASDNFESYPTGGVTGQNGGTGFTSAYVSDNTAAVNVAAESLSYSGGPVSSSGGSKDLQVSAAGTNLGASGVDNGTLGRTYAAQAGTVYFSLLLRTNATANNEFFQVGLANSTGGEPALSIGASGASAAAFDFFVRSPGGSQTTSTTVMNPNQTYFLVGKASKVSGSTTYNQIDLFVNPSTATEPATATVSRTGDSTLASLSTLNVRTARFTAGDIFSVDNVTIGTTYADVVPVPEPAAAGLFALAGGVLLVRRRRTARG